MSCRAACSQDGQCPASSASALGLIIDKTSEMHVAAIIEHWSHSLPCRQSLRGTGHTRYRAVSPSEVLVTLATMPSFPQRHWSHSLPCPQSLRGTGHIRYRAVSPSEALATLATVPLVPQRHWPHSLPCRQSLRGTGHTRYRADSPSEALATLATAA